MKSINNLNALCAYLETKYGADKARSVLANEYNYTGPLHGQASNMESASKQANKQAVAKQDPMLRLTALRRQWSNLNAEYQAMDKRTHGAKSTKIVMEMIVMDGQSIKQQMEVA